MEHTSSSDGRPGTSRRGLRHLARGARLQRRLFGWCVAVSAVYGVGTTAGGWLLGRVTDRVIAPSIRRGRLDARELAAAVGVLALAAVITAVAVALRRSLAGTMTQNLQAHHRREVSRQLLRLPLSWHHRHPAGQLLSNAGSDVEAAFNVFNMLPFAIGVVVMLGASSAAMLAADRVLGLVGLMVLPAVVLANAVYQRRVSPRIVRAQRLRAAVAAVAHESFEGALVVKTLGRETWETQRFARQVDDLRAANVVVGRTRGVFDPLIEALPSLGILVVLAVGAQRVQLSAATAGDVVQVAYLLGVLAFPVRAIGWLLGELPRAVVGWDRINEVLSAGGSTPYGYRALPRAAGGPDAAAGGARAGVDAVSYGYAGEGSAADDESPPVLHSVTLDVPAGTTVAVVGPTGSGKSTLAGLLVRLVDPVSGRVLLDGVDLRQLRRGELSTAAVLVSQGTFVFDDTVRGNVTLGFPAGDEEVWRALALARADGFVAALPAGLDERVGERGAALSGGQRQRLALARALVRRPRLLVLDDSTSAVDPRVEAGILEGLRARSTGTTVVVVANRKATISLADEVVHLDRGRVVDRGSHEDLRARDEGYRHLVDAYEEAGDAVGSGGR